MKLILKSMGISFKSGIGLLALCLILTVNIAQAEPAPEVVIETTVQKVLNEFVSERESLETDKRRLYKLVDELASPLFDFHYVSKLVLAKNWKTASEQQRADFAQEFRKLLVITYATALFQYTGEEKMTFEGTEIKERKGVLFAKVDSQVILGEGAPIPVEYALIQNAAKEWKIYNLTVGSLNMALNYRKVIQSSIRSSSLDDVIASMKENNNKNY
ncbi:MAG: hypothetical protein GKR95_04645 [Gammaproteobacteria bacterium]|nr:hypothetical protein [Gammaproteobacteria bacterium]